MASPPNVLRVNVAEEAKRYRNAVSEIIQQILDENSEPGDRYTLWQIAESIGVSLGTITNAYNKKTDFSSTFLSRLAKQYGSHILDPFAALSGGRVIPIEADEAADALPPVSAVVHRLSIVRTPGRPVHTELLDMEGDIDAAIRALTALKCRCDKLRTAA